MHLNLQGMLDPKDGGVRSRKLWYAVGTSMAILLVAVLAGSYMPALVPMLPEVYGALIAVLSIYSGANFAGKWNISKYAQATQKPTEPKA